MAISSYESRYWEYDSLTIPIELEGRDLDDLARRFATVVGEYLQCNEEDGWVPDQATDLASLLDAGCVECGKVERSGLFGKVTRWRIGAATIRIRRPLSGTKGP